MEAKEGSRPSILMFPWLAHGHISPYLELAKLLSKHHFTIFFCSTPINLKSFLQSSSDLCQLPIHPVELHLPPTPELPPHLHSTKHAPSHLIPQLFNSFHASKPAFSAILTSLNPTMLIYDMCQPWAATAAAALGIPAVHFATTGAAAYSFFYHQFTKKDAPFPYDAIYLRRREWAALRAATTVSNFNDQHPDDRFAHFTRSHVVVLMRTSRVIEGKYIDYLSLLLNKRIVAVGPLVTPPTTTSDDDDSDIMDWLTKKDKASTILISFGSENYLNKNQMQEMAKGLESSDANFIWVVRSPPGVVEREETKELGLPAGFVDRVRERGRIVEGWAPQTKILAHENVCGFISHCGLSSTIESLYFEVPVIAIPMRMDQPLNCRLLVEAGVGVEVARDDNGDFTGDEVAAAIKRVVGTGEEMRVRAAEMRDAMRNEEEHAVSQASEHLRRICMVSLTNS